MSLMVYDKKVYISVVVATAAVVAAAADIKLVNIKHSYQSTW